MTIRVGSCGSLESRLRSVRRVSHGQGRLHPIAIDRRTRYQEDETSFGPAMMLSPGNTYDHSTVELGQELTTSHLLVTGSGA